jgi:hypothetical protein
VSTQLAPAMESPRSAQTRAAGSQRRVDRHWLSRSQVAPHPRARGGDAPGVGVAEEAVEAACEGEAGNAPPPGLIVVASAHLPRPEPPARRMYTSAR